MSLLSYCQWTWLRIVPIAKRRRRRVPVPPMPQRSTNAYVSRGEGRERAHFRDPSESHVFVARGHIPLRWMPRLMTSDVRVNLWAADADPLLARVAAPKGRLLEVRSVVARRVPRRQQVQCPMRCAGLDRGPGNDGGSVPMHGSRDTSASEVALHRRLDRRLQMLGVLREWAAPSDAYRTKGRIPIRRMQKYLG